MPCLVSKNFSAHPATYILHSTATGARAAELARGSTIYVYVAGQHDVCVRCRPIPSPTGNTYNTPARLGRARLNGAPRRPVPTHTQTHTNTPQHANTNAHTHMHTNSSSSLQSPSASSRTACFGVAEPADGVRICTATRTHEAVSYLSLPCRTMYVLRCRMSSSPGRSSSLAMFACARQLAPTAPGKTLLECGSRARSHA